MPPMTTRTPVKYWPSDQSGPAARSSASQVWRCVSMKPGIAILFVPSMIVAPSAGIDGATIIDGTNKIAIPGFIDTHRHTWEALLRAAGPDWSLGQYFTGVRVVMGGIY